MKNTTVYPVIGMLAAALMANVAVGGQGAKNQDKSSQTQGETVKGKIVSLSDYISSEVGEIPGQIDQQQQQRQQQEQQQRQRRQELQQEDELNQGGRDQPPGQDEPLRQQQREEEGIGKQADQAGLSARSGQDHGGETLVLVSKEGGLFGSSDKAYVLWFGPRTGASGMEMTQRKALNIAQAGSSQFGALSDEESQQGQRSATDRAGQQQKGEQESSEREYVRGESSGSQSEVSVTGKKVSKGGLNVLWVQSIDQGQGENESGKGGQKGFGQENEQGSQGDRN